MGIPYTDNITVLNAVGATTTSNGYDVSKRQLISIEFITSGGTSSFSIDVSNDNVNWITSIAFQDVQSTTPSTLVTSKSVASGTAGAIVPPNFAYIRVVATWTSGTATAIIESKG